MWQCICRDLVVGRRWDRSKEVYLGDVRYLSWVIFDGFSGDCRLADVRFYPIKVQPGPVRKRCVWPDPCDSSFQTGGSNHALPIADYEWIAIQPMPPNKPRGVPRVNDRRVLNGIF